MSGVRRKTKYRKSVENDVLNALPEPKEGEAVVRVVASRGGNLIEVETGDGSRSLCRLPNRYRKVVWVKRGTLLIVETCLEAYSTTTGEEGKVRFLVNHIVFTDDQIKNLRVCGHLPAAFDEKCADEEVSSLDDMLMQGNRNRRPNLDVEESSDEGSSGGDSDARSENDDGQGHGDGDEHDDSDDSNSE